MEEEDVLIEVHVHRVCREPVVRDHRIIDGPIRQDRTQRDGLSQFFKDMPGRDGEQDALNIDHESAEVVALRLSAIGLPGTLTGVHAGQVDVVPMKVVQVLVIQNQFVRHCHLLSTPPHSATIHVARPQVLQGEFAEIVGRGRDDQTHGTGRPAERPDLPEVGREHASLLPRPAAKAQWRAASGRLATMGLV